MTLKRKMDSQEDKEYWEFVEKTAEKVESYPVWKRGGETAGTEQKNGTEMKAAPMENPCEFI